VYLPFSLLGTKGAWVAQSTSVYDRDSLQWPVHQLVWLCDDSFLGVHRVWAHHSFTVDSKRSMIQSTYSLTSKYVIAGQHFTKKCAPFLVFMFPFCFVLIVFLVDFFQRLVNKRGDVLYPLIRCSSFQDPFEPSLR
jgi:hypothetical protein